MAYIDKVKEEIGWLKIIFTILIATDISLIAWLIQNYGRVNPFLFIGGFMMDWREWAVLGVFIVFLVCLGIVVGTAIKHASKN